MRKNTKPSKLQVNAQTLRRLSPRELEEAGGALKLPGTASCFCTLTNCAGYATCMR